MQGMFVAGEQIDKGDVVALNSDGELVKVETEEEDSGSDLETYEGPHRTSEVHECMIEGVHQHRPGIYDAFIRPEVEVTDEAMNAVEVEEEIIDFAGEDCPVCELFGYDKNPLGQTRAQLRLGVYRCSSGHKIKQRDMEYLMDQKTEEDDFGIKFVAIDGEWVNKLALLWGTGSHYSAAVEIWKEIHR